MECGLQGHDEETCWDIHPKLFKKKKEENRTLNSNAEGMQWQQKVEVNARTKRDTNSWKLRKNRYRKDQYGYILGEVKNLEGVMETSILLIL